MMDADVNAVLVMMMIMMNDAMKTMLTRYASSVTPVVDRVVGVLRNVTNNFRSLAPAASGDGVEDHQKVYQYFIFIIYFIIYYMFLGSSTAGSGDQRSRGVVRG